MSTSESFMDEFKKLVYDEYESIIILPEERAKIHEEVSKMTDKEVMAELFGPNWREEQATLRVKQGSEGQRVPGKKMQQVLE